VTLQFIAGVIAEAVAAEAVRELLNDLKVEDTLDEPKQSLEADLTDRNLPRTR
jgi:hypothetical protein